MRNSNVLFLLVLAMASTATMAQNLAPNAPVDDPKGVTARGFEKIEKAVAPYVAQGKKTYPDAKKRFIAGLPGNQSFFVSVRLTDVRGLHEDVFVQVLHIDPDTSEIMGRVASHIDLVQGYTAGQKITLTEDRVRDWTIAHPDGTEEGNVVGKFLDTYRPEN